jgi:hypothetical protein
VWLSAGTVDRIGIEIVAAAAGGTMRFGIYTDDDGIPLNLIAETAAQSAAGTGVIDVTVDIDIDKPGVYWLASVAQGNAVAGQVRAYTRGAMPVSLGTSAPSGAGNAMSRVQAGVTGALPATAVLDAAPHPQVQRIHIRYATP